MGKRSRLRHDSRAKARLLLLMVLAGGTLFLGLHFFEVEGFGFRGRFVEESGASEPLFDSRGTIFDRNFKELAVTLQKVSVYANVREVNKENVAEKLAPVLHASSQDLQQVMSSDYFQAWLARNISQEEEESIASLGLPGVFLHKERARFYPEKETAAHVVGFVGKSMGLAGVEHTYNTLLSKDSTALRYSGAQKVNEQMSAAGHGRYLVLNLDLKIQKILEKLVGDLGEGTEGARLAALLMECRTGKIIAEAGYPAFDPNDFQNYSPAELENILAQDIVVPYEIKRFFWDASLLQSHFESGESSTPWSVNSASRSLGSQLRLWDRLGLNDSLDVDFIRPDRGIMQTANHQEVAVLPNYFDSVPERATPLHIVSAINGLLMGGNLPEPHVIDRIAVGDGQVLQLQNKMGKPTVDHEVAGEINRLLTAQLHRGPLSSGYLEVDSLMYSVNDKGRDYAHNSMYMSLIPKDKPELMLFVFAQIPPFSPVPAKTKSSFMIAQSAHEVMIPMVAMEKVMSNLADMMTAEEKMQMNFELERQVGKGVVPAISAQNDIYGTMPDLKGLSLRKSLRSLQDLQLEIQITGTGVVVEQKPEAGQQIKRGELCRLILKPH
jgi:cell division protein FtsI (penicillin-binding protein 3)